jgi:hypothetical protein
MNEYTFSDFKRDIEIGCLESMFEYNGKIYHLSIIPGNYKLFFKKKRSPLWRLFNDTDNVEIIRSSKNTICDEIIIEGKNLSEIWEDIKII